MFLEERAADVLIETVSEVIVHASQTFLEYVRGGRVF